MGEYGRRLQARLSGKGPALQASRVAAEPPRMSSKEFQRERRMFCVIDGKAYVADQTDSRYHREWMDGLVEGGMDDRTYKLSPRGYYLAPDMVWYRGPFQMVSMRTICEHLSELVDLMQLPLDTKVYSGARIGHDDVLSGEAMMGTIEDMLDIEPAPQVEGNARWNEP